MVCHLLPFAKVGQNFDTRRAYVVDEKFPTDLKQRKDFWVSASKTEETFHP